MSSYDESVSSIGAERESERYLSNLSVSAAPQEAEVTMQRKDTRRLKSFILA